MERSRFRRFLTLGIGVTTVADVLPAPAAVAHGRAPQLELLIDGVLESFPLHAGRPLVIIGHSRRCDVRLSSRQIHAQHAYVQLFRGGAYCVDLGSPGGIVWGTERRRAGWLRPGEPVTIGPFHISSRVPEYGGHAEFACDAESLLSDREFAMFGTRAV